MFAQLAVAGNSTWGIGLAGKWTQGASVFAGRLGSYLKFTDSRHTSLAGFRSWRARHRKRLPGIGIGAPEILVAVERHALQ